MKHFLSDSGIWKVIAEIVKPDGRVIQSEGEAVISVGKTETINDTWISSDEINRRSTYRITPVSKNEMVAESTDPDMPRVTGALKIDRNILHFRYQVDGTGVNGYSIISRKRNVCYTYGAHYDGSTPLMTWTAMVNKKVRMKKN